MTLHAARRCPIDAAQAPDPTSPPADPVTRTVRIASHVTRQRSHHRPDIAHTTAGPHRAAHTSARESLASQHPTRFAAQYPTGLTPHDSTNLASQAPTRFASHDLTRPASQHPTRFAARVAR
jgi:hypothetical protein